MLSRCTYAVVYINILFLFLVLICCILFLHFTSTSYISLGSFALFHFPQMHHTYSHATQIIMVFFFYLTLSFFLFSSISINLTFCYSNEKAFNIREISQDQSSNFRYLFFAYFCPCHYQLGIMKYFMSVTCSF